MKKKFYLLILLCSPIFQTSFAQNKGNDLDEYNPESVKGRKEFRASKGSCVYIIELLRASQSNDSIAINIFKDEYEIVNMPSRTKDWIVKQDYNKIIQIFSLEENEKYNCRLKLFKGYDPVLLID